MSLFPSKILATHAVLENVVAGMPSRGNPLDPPLPGNRGNVAMISIPAKSLRLYRYKKKYFGHWDNHDHNWGGIHLHGMDVEPEAISLCRSYILAEFNTWGPVAHSTFFRSQFDGVFQIFVLSDVNVLKLDAIHIYYISRKDWETILKLPWMILEKPSNWTLLQDFKRQVCREISRVAPLKDAELKDLKKVAAGEMTSGVWSCLRIAELVHVDECVDIMKQPQVT